MGILTGKYESVDDVPADGRAAGDDAKFMQRYFTQEVLDAVQKAAEIADEAGCTPAQLALAWCLRQAFVSSVIVGATKTSHVDDNVAAADLELTDDVIDAYDEILEPVAAS
jgi:aryl-alcohol dehydrogenase-like predicted oxidoreductase